MYPVRSAEAPGGTAADGGVTQSGDAEKEGDADQVLHSYTFLVVNEVDFSHPLKHKSINTFRDDTFHF